MKVSSKNNEVVIEYKEGKEWLRRLSVDSDFEEEDWEDLADSIGEEGRFFIENGVLTEYDIEDQNSSLRFGPHSPFFGHQYLNSDNL